MNPQNIFCPNMARLARGQVGQGNLIGRGCTRRRYRGTVCHKTFSSRTRTMFHCRHTTMQLMVQIITLVNQGYPIVAIEAAFGIQARTARDWVGAAERQSGTLQQHLVQQPRELSQVQADELGVPAV